MSGANLGTVNVAQQPQPGSPQQINQALKLNPSNGSNYSDFVGDNMNATQQALGHKKLWHLAIGIALGWILARNINITSGLKV